MRSIQKLFAILGIAVGVVTGTPSAIASDSLGIGLTVIPLNDGSKANLSFNNQLWFGVEQGKSLTRRFQVSSASAIEQRISFQLFDVLYENGSRKIRTEKQSDSLKWVKFEPSTVVIKPGGMAEISMTYSIPVEEKDAAYESFLRVNAVAAKLPKTTNTSGVRVEMVGAAAIDTPVWLGIGDPATLVSDFEISKVFGALIQGDKYLRVVIKNTGKTPLGIGGTVQLTDPAFSDRNFGPFGYRSPEIPPGKIANIDVPMSDEISEGLWNIYVVAEQGNIRKTKLFKEEITYKPIGDSFPYQYLLILLAGIGFVFGWRLLKSSSKGLISAKQKVSKNELIKVQEEQERIIADLNALLEKEAAVSKPKKVKKAATKKKAVAKKKSTSSKVSTSKRPKKKAAAKKK